MHILFGQPDASRLTLQSATLSNCGDIPKLVQRYLKAKEHTTHIMMCTTCEDDLHESRFGKYKTPDGKIKTRRECNACRVKREAVRAKANREQVNTYKKNYKQNHKEKVKEMERIRTCNKRIYDPQYNLKMRIIKNTRSHLFRTICEEDIECSTPEFRSWFEYMFPHNMTWQNADEWQCDHVIPLSFFDLTCRYEYQLASHWSNVRPLQSHDNLLKGNKIDKEIIRAHLQKFKEFVALNTEYQNNTKRCILPSIQSWFDGDNEQDDETFIQFLKRTIRSEASNSSQTTTNFC